MSGEREGRGAGGFALPSVRLLLGFYNEIIAREGSAQGGVDAGALEAAIARPGNLIGYGDGQASVAVVACAIAYSIVRRHPFLDGNKRVAFAAFKATLELNGLSLFAEPEDATRAIQGIADGSISEAEFVAWAEVNSRPPWPR